MADYSTAVLNEADWADPDIAVIGFIFPNTVISMAPTPMGRHNLQFTKLFPGQTIDSAFSLTTTVALAGADSEAERDFAQSTHDNILIINGQEDYLLAADAQRNLQFAPDDFTILYASIEPAVQDFQRHLSTAIGWPLE